MEHVISDSSQVQHQFLSFPPLKLTGFSREDLKAYFLNTWELYEKLFSSIRSDKSYYQNPDPLRHPLIFYFGHTAVFYINKLKIAGYSPPRINDRYEVLFAQGVDPAAPEGLKKEINWPSVDEVRAYRASARQWVLDYIETCELSFPVTESDELWALFMGLEHDRIHWETSSMLIRQYELSQVQCPEGFLYAPQDSPAPENEMIAVSGGNVKLGKSKDAEFFGWDNEYGALEKEVPPFQASRFLISNAEFLGFWQSGGYENRENWTPEGWEWKQKTQTRHPKFWIEEGEGKFAYRAMFDRLDMPLSWPAEVNGFEAQAFCNWKGEGTRLLSEAEFRLLANRVVCPSGDPVFDPCFNLNIRYGSPTPVNFLKEGKSPDGFYDLYGNVWEWLSDDFYGLPKFRVHYLYKDFSADYMDKDHATLLGGSWASSGTSASRHYRLWFRRHFFQHAGFRIARNV